MVTARHRANGEGSIYPRKQGGFAAYAWVVTPAGRKMRKYVYGKTREEVHAKWVALTREAAQGPVLTKVPTVGQFLDRWLEETVAPNLAPLTHATYESHVRNYLKPGAGERAPGQAQCLGGADVVEPAAEAVPVLCAWAGHRQGAMLFGGGVLWRVPLGEDCARCPDCASVCLVDGDAGGTCWP